MAWLVRGKAHFKRKIAEKVMINPSLLPYREDVLSFLHTKREEGRLLVLATASDQIYADAVSSHLGLFFAAHGSDGNTNLSGKRKGAALAAKYPHFAYMGNSKDDLSVWRDCGEALVVAAPRSVLRKLRPFKEPTRVFPAHRSGIRELAQFLRVHQWAKNLIVFIPLIAAHRLFDTGGIVKEIFAFLAFCFLASAIYIFNDLMDIDADRAHPTKRRRPIAAGRITIPTATIAAPALAIASFACALGTNSLFMIVLGIYLALTSAYTLALKRLVIVDVLCLAILYTLRLVGGHFAADVAFSPWLLTFSMFVFFSLSLVKRYSELSELRAAGQIEVKGRGYTGNDLEIVAMLGVGSGLISVMVMALYITSDTVQRLYHQPYLLLALCPILLFWIARLWMLAHRGELKDDPVLFALRDRASYLAGFCGALILVLAAVL